MPEIEIYTSPFCGYCHRAKRLLTTKNAEFTEIDVMMDSSRKSEMVDRAGGRTSVPQIFINGEHIGGSDDLAKLESDGELDGLLAN